MYPINLAPVNISLWTPSNKYMLGIHILATDQGDLMIHKHAAANKHAYLYVARRDTATYIKWRWNLEHLCIFFNIDSPFIGQMFKGWIYQYFLYFLNHVTIYNLLWLSNSKHILRMHILDTGWREFMIQKYPAANNNTCLYVTRCHTATHINWNLDNFLYKAALYKNASNFIMILLCWPGGKSFQKSTFLKMIKDQHCHVTVIHWYNISASE